MTQKLPVHFFSCFPGHDLESRGRAVRQQVAVANVHFSYLVSSPVSRIFWSFGRKPVDKLWATTVCTERWHRSDRGHCSRMAVWAVCSQPVQSTQWLPVAVLDTALDGAPRVH